MSEIEVGQAAEFTKTVTETDVVLFAGITGDLNPAHIDQVWAEASRFGGRIAHGMLSASFISTGLTITLLFETLAYFNTYRFPTGVTVSGLSLVLSILVFFAVSWVTRERAAAALDADVRLVMSV